MEKFYLFQESFKIPQWRMSLAFSIMTHLLVVLLIFFIPLNKKESRPPFIARLVTPDELMREFQVPKPSDAPPKELYRRHPGSAAPKSVSPRQERSQEEKAAFPVPSSAQPTTGTAEKKAAPGNGTEGTMGNGLSENGELPGSQSQKGRGATDSEKSPRIIVPAPALREKLLDREVIGNIAKREETKHDSSVTFDTTEFKYESYMLKLKDRIESIWQYPQEEARRGIYGDLEISFTIKKNGMLGDVSLKRTSGHPNLDKAAMQALKDGEPFWPLPDEWGKDSLTIDGHFIYSIYGTYIR